MTEPVRSVVILAGGRSRRLGREKPFVEIAGRAVLERQLDATVECTDVVLSVRETPAFESWLAERGWEPVVGRDGPTFARGGRSIRPIADPHPDLGPVAGLASGLAAIAARTAVVLAGDLPFVTADLVERLHELLDESPDADAVVPAVGGRNQPLCAAYRAGVAREAGRHLARETTARGPSMHGLLERLSVRTPAPAELAGLGDIATLTRGIDSPEDLDWALGVTTGGP